MTENQTEIDPITKQTQHKLSPVDLWDMSVNQWILHDVFQL